MKRKFRLVHTQARENVVKAIWEAPDGFEVTLSEPTRNLDQNALFHALCGELEASSLEWGGERPTASQWKALMVSAHSVATGTECELVQGIEGEWVSLRESTATMTKERGSSLIEYVKAFMADQGI